MSMHDETSFMNNDASPCYCFKIDVKTLNFMIDKSLFEKHRRLASSLTMKQKIDWMYFIARNIIIKEEPIITNFALS